MAQESSIYLLCINDFHAEIQESSFAPGAAKLAGAIEAFRAEHPNAIVLFGGDNYKGDPISECTDGAPVAFLMRQLAAEASVLGNHDFDCGVDQIRAWRDEAGCPFLAANLVDSATGSIPDFALPYVIVTANKRKIVILGIALPEPMETYDRPSDVHGLVTTDPVEAAQRWISRLRSGKEPCGYPDAIIALTHLGLRYAPDGKTPVGPEAIRLCEEAKGLDGVFTAHFHQFMALDIDGVPVVQGGGQGRGFAWLRLDFGESGLVSVVPGFETLTSNQKALAQNEAVLAEVERCKALAMQTLGQVVAKLDHEIVHRSPETAELDMEGSPLSALGIQVMLDLTGCQIALLYAGRMGRGLAAGDLTLYQLYQTLFFENGIVTMKLPGAQIWENIETGIRTLARESASPLAVGGLSVTADYAKPYGSRVEGITLPDGSQLLPDQLYTVAIDNYLAENVMGFDFTQGVDITYTNQSVRKGIIDAVTTTGRIEHAFDKTMRVKNKPAR